MTHWLEDTDEPLTPEEPRACQKLIDYRAGPDEWATALMHLAAPIAVVLLLLGAFGKFLWDQVVK